MNNHTKHDREPSPLFDRESIKIDRGPSFFWFNHHKKNSWAKVPLVLLFKLPLPSSFFFPLLHTHPGTKKNMQHFWRGWLFQTISCSTPKMTHTQRSNIYIITRAQMLILFLIFSILPTLFFFRVPPLSLSLPHPKFFYFL